MLAVLHFRYGSPVHILAVFCTHPVKTPTVGQVKAGTQCGSLRDAQPLDAFQSISMNKGQMTFVEGPRVKVESDIESTLVALDTGK